MRKNTRLSFNSFYLHSRIFLFIRINFFFLSRLLSIEIQIIYFSLNTFYISRIFNNLTFLITPRRAIFSFGVTIIVRIITLYRNHYLGEIQKNKYYIFLVYLFTIRILVVINISNIFYIILGWDGLGLIRFFLIIFYGNHKRISAGVFRLLINRIGDSFFLVILCLLKTQGLNFQFTRYELTESRVMIIIAIAFMTKTAIFPFSRWLPIAIAAPTPIRALVHSSTLVTAGLYLFIRINYFFYAHERLCQCLVIFGLLTSAYAGAISLFEYDFKKLIALSTLRHLGFILIGFGAGLLKFRFFHLLVHALFKRLLFLRFGGLILAQNHAQDGRYIGIAALTNKNRSQIMIFRLFNLLGLPRTRGFFSKDLILEAFHYGSNTRTILCWILYLNVSLTYIYTYKIFSLLFGENNMAPYQVKLGKREVSLCYNIIVRLISIVFGLFYINSTQIWFEYLSMARLIKYSPILINVTFILCLLSTLTITPEYKKHFIVLIIRKIVWLATLQRLMNIFLNKILGRNRIPVIPPKEIQIPLQNSVRILVTPPLRGVFIGCLVAILLRLILL